MGTWIILIIVMLPGCFGSHIKQWLPNINLDNSDNWNKKRLPCTNDVLKLLDQDTAVYMQANLTIKELILPMTGEVVLGDDVMLSFSDAPDPSPGCTPQGEELVFVRQKPKSWFNPYNWCSANDTDHHCSEPYNQQDLLDTERIPCQYDTAFFPPNHEFYVDIGGRATISVGSIVFGNERYSASESFRSFLQSSSGLKQFTASNDTTRSKMKIVREGCNDVTGCKCGNDHELVGEMICRQMEHLCVKTNCSKPFVPVGSCCDKCGAMITLEYGGGFSMQRLKSFLKQDDIFPELLREGDIVTTVSKTFHDKIQIVLTDWTGGKHAIDFGKMLRQQLNKDIKGDRRFGLVSLTLILSEDEPVIPTPAPQKSKPSSMNSGSIVGIVIGVILILTILTVVACFFYRRRQGMPFLPFINPSCKSTEIELGPSVSFDNGVVDLDPALRGFDNPMYDSPVSKEHEPTFFQDPSKAIPEISFTNGTTAFENPVYSQEGLEEDTDL